MDNGYSSAIAAAAAEAAQRAMFKEEEMTHYGDEAISGGWEFKIVRARAGRFRSSEEFKKLLAQEEEFGWELLEKLDNSRVRFKRHIKERSGDSLTGSERDPYRSFYGGFTIAQVIGLVIAIMGIILIAKTLLF